MQFCDDFDLIISNCETYNGAESEYTRQVRQLKAEFYNLVDVYFDHSGIGVERHHSRSVTTTPPREPTSSSNMGGEGSPKKSGAAITTDGSSQEEANVMQDEEHEEILSRQASSEVGSCGEVEDGRGLGEEMEMGGQQLPQRRSWTVGMAASSDVDTEDSEDDLPSFRDIFSTPSKL